jgi:polyribonucleotide 5'-hydroxyl-kinase
LDISQCSISLPGSIAATLVERPTSIEEGFPQNAPMVYHFGHTKLDNPASNSGKNNTVLYDGIVSEMAGMVKKRLAANKKVRTSGKHLCLTDNLDYLTW